jgi:hypothetical protein
MPLVDDHHIDYRVIDLDLLQVKRGSISIFARHLSAISSAEFNAVPATCWGVRRGVV